MHVKSQFLKFWQYKADTELLKWQWFFSLYIAQYTRNLLTIFSFRNYATHFYGIDSTYLSEKDRQILSVRGVWWTSEMFTEVQ